MSSELSELIHSSGFQASCASQLESKYSSLIGEGRHVLALYTGVECYGALSTFPYLNSFARACPSANMHAKGSGATSRRHGLTQGIINIISVRIQHRGATSDL